MIKHVVGLYEIISQLYPHDKSTKKLVISPWSSHDTQHFPSPPPAGCALFAASRRPTAVLGADADATHWPLLQACHPPENAGKMLGKLWEFLGHVPDISWNVQKSPVMLWSKHGNCRNHQGNCYKVLKDVERCWNSQINSWPISSFLCKPDLAISCDRQVVTPAGIVQSADTVQPVGPMGPSWGPVHQCPEKGWSVEHNNIITDILLYIYIYIILYNYILNICVTCVHLSGHSLKNVRGNCDDTSGFVETGAVSSLTVAAHLSLSPPKSRSFLWSVKRTPQNWQGMDCTTPQHQLCM